MPLTVLARERNIFAGVIEEITKYYENKKLIVYIREDCYEKFPLWLKAHRNDDDT